VIRTAETYPGLAVGESAAGQRSRRGDSWGSAGHAGRDQSGFGTPFDRADRVWGLTPAQIHDRFWASRGVEVVRPGCGLQTGGDRLEAPDGREGRPPVASLKPPASGLVSDARPVFYLLAPEHALLAFDLAPALKQFHWIKPRAVRMRIVDGRTDPYRELVLSDGQDRLIAIRRQYQPTNPPTVRCWITPDRRLAALWAAARGGREASSRLRAALGRDDTANIVADGRVHRADDPASALEWLDVVGGAWGLSRAGRVSAVVDGVYLFQPGVWVHHTARIGRNVRFIPPVWVGAGADIPDGAVAVGPLFIPDEQPAGPGPIDWDALRSPRWRLLPRLRPGRFHQSTKRAFDIAFSLLVLLATLPLYPLIILAIFIEDGWPPFFAHTRQTLGGRNFPCYKFRTMCRDAEKMKDQLKAANQVDGPQFYIADDPRLLRVGRVLRRFQLDELPQFINVLLGHMSVVGPRPSPDNENQFCPAWREARLSVRPGITGLWQIRRTRRPETDFQEWIRYDLEYVQHASWRLDIWILVQTVRKVLLP
jgi:lipopolysaccharide/colanic/teichoic acid biosynthesis glycosyltransferase